MIWILSLLTIVVSSVFLPWWCSALACLLFGVLNLSPLRAGLSSFLALFGSWIGAAFFLDRGVSFTLGSRLAEILQLPHPIMVYFVFALVGGLWGGLFALGGCHLRRLFGSAEEGRLFST